MKRQGFFHVVATGAGTLASGCATSDSAEPVATGAAVAKAVVQHSSAGAIVKPPRLRPGDVVGIIAPAGPLREADELRRARRQAELLGLRPRFGAHIHDRYGYLAGRDAARAHDFNAFVASSDVRAIFALRGGYGTMRILEDIDYDALRRDPKVVLGFSDLTALLNAITWRTGIVTFHGPVAGHALTDSALSGISRAVMAKLPLGVMRAPGVRTIAGGHARGRLTGGNLSLVAALSGTPYAVPCDGRIVILEDVKEAPYRVDRMLTQLTLNGDFSRAAGVALGQFPYCVAKPDDLPSLTIDETLNDRLGAIGKPVLANLEIGHIEEQWTLPLGIEATLDADAGTLTVEEAAVS